MGRTVGAIAKHKPFKAALDRLLDQAEGRHAGPKRWDDIALALYKRAKAGDVQAIKEIADRTDGKVPQSIGGDAELGPIGVVITGVIRADDELPLDADDPFSAGLAIEYKRKLAELQAMPEAERHKLIGMEEEKAALVKDSDG